jgi:hypothetical protein
VNDDFLAELAAETEAAQVAPPEDALEYVQKLGAEVNLIDARLAKWGEVAAALQMRRNEILGKILPEFMDDPRRRLDSFSVDGVKFTVDNYYKASIPADNPDPGHNWLEENGHGDLIRNTIVVALPKESEEMAKEIETYIRQRYQEANVERKRAVPWASLTAWLKELWNAPDPNKKLPPLDIMGATVGRIVKIKPPKKDK